MLTVSPLAYVFEPKVIFAFVVVSSHDVVTV